MRTTVRTVLLRVTLALVATAAVGVVAAGPAGAGEAEGCSWSVRSLGRDGAVVDTASGPGAGATADDPLRIDPRGRIAYEATTDAVIADGTWKVSAKGGPVISFSGAITNGSRTTESSGTEDLESRLTVPAGPFGRVALISGLIRVDVVATGAGGSTCVAGGWLETTGNPLASATFVVGGLAALGGLSLLFFGRPLVEGTAAGGAASGGGGAGGAAAAPTTPAGAGGAVGGAPAEGAGPRPGPIGGVP